MSTYTFSIQNDFHALTEPLDTSQLQALMNILFPTNASSINTFGDIVSIIFDTALVTNEILTLTQNINTYQNIYLSNVIDSLPDNTIVIYEKQSTGINGGESIANSWTTRNINNVSGNSSSWITLNNDNTFILLPGKYLVTGFIPAYQAGRHQARLFNVSNNVVQSVGTSAYDSQLSQIHSLFINNAPNIFKIQHQCNVTVDPVGLGIATNISNEIYSILRIDKLY